MQTSDITQQQQQQLRRSRRSYKRSQTVAILPAVTTQQPTRPSESAADARQRTSSRSSRGSLGSSTSGSACEQQLTQSSSRAAFGQQQQQHQPVSTAKSGSGRRHLLGRTPSSPSVLLSRVRERIREKVAETASAEWSDAAAVERERRQRAADAFEAQRRRNQRKQSSPPLNDDWSAMVSAGSARRPLRRVRTRSDPASTRHRFSSSGSESVDRDDAKVAFRQRSTSEDTYIRKWSMTSRRSSHDAIIKNKQGGVVCSDDDLRAIVFEHKLRVSPMSSRTAQRRTTGRAASLDTAATFASFESLSSNPSPLQHRTSCAAVLPSTLPIDCSAVFQHAVPESTTAVLTSEIRTTAGDWVPADADDTVVASAAPAAVPEVIYDEQGQTWDVYGAEFDPEILGQAIQTHLERIMRCQRQGSDLQLVDDTASSPNIEQQTIATLNVTDSKANRTTIASDRNESRIVGPVVARNFINRYFLRHLCTSASAVNG